MNINKYGWLSNNYLIICGFVHVFTIYLEIKIHNLLRIERKLWFEKLNMLNFSNHASLDAWQPLAEIKVAPPTPTPGSESTCMCWFVHVTVGSLREGRKVRMKGKHF